MQNQNPQTSPQRVEENKIVKTEERKLNRYNWDTLKLEYMQGPWDTLSEFRRFKGFRNWKKSSYLMAKMAGWAKEKQELLSKAAAKAAINLVEEKAEEIRKLRERQSGLARKLQDIGEQSLPNLKPKTLEEARKIIQTGMQEERAAVGVDQKGGAKSLTQVNVNLPKTNFDKLIDGRDFEDILKFIADIRRERARRIGKGIIEPSEAEIE